MRLSVSSTSLTICLLSFLFDSLKFLAFCLHNGRKEEGVLIYVRTSFSPPPSSSLFDQLLCICCQEGRGFGIVVVVSNPSSLSSSSSLCCHHLLMLYQHNQGSKIEPVVRKFHLSLTRVDQCLKRCTVVLFCFVLSLSLWMWSCVSSFPEIISKIYQIQLTASNCCWQESSNTQSASFMFHFVSYFCVVSCWQ